MDKDKIAQLIRKKRKELGLTQQELAERLAVTEKAVSRWETARGTPDISLLLPLSAVLGVDVSELLSGEENAMEKILRYEIESSRTTPRGIKALIGLSYALSILCFLYYLRLAYNPGISLNYFLQAAYTAAASLLALLGNWLYASNIAEKVEDKLRIRKLSLAIVFLYYTILMVNMTVLGRFQPIRQINLVPFRTIISILRSGSAHSIWIDLVGNFMVFMPLEFFLIELFRLNKPFVNYLAAFAMVLLIELLQYSFGLGMADVDDVILNLAGMILFRILYSEIKKRWLKRRKSENT